MTMALAHRPVSTKPGNAHAHAPLFPCMVVVGLAICLKTTLQWGSDCSLKRRGAEVFVARSAPQQMGAIGYWDPDQTHGYPGASTAGHQLGGAGPFIGQIAVREPSLPRASSPGHAVYAPMGSSRQMHGPFRAAIGTTQNTAEWRWQAQSADPEGPHSHALQHQASWGHAPPQQHEMLQRSASDNRPPIGNFATPLSGISSDPLSCQHAPGNESDLRPSLWQRTGDPVTQVSPLAPSCQRNHRATMEIFCLTDSLCAQVWAATGRTPREGHAAQAMAYQSPFESQLPSFDEAETPEGSLIQRSPFAAESRKSTGDSQQLNLALSK